MPRNTFNYLVNKARFHLIPYLKEARIYAKKYGHDPNNFNTRDQWDPFRHCYASAASTVDFGISISHFLGDLNESARLGDNPLEERNADLFNNAIGRYIAEQAESYGKEAGPISRDDLAKRCSDALNKGVLIIDPKKDPRNSEFPSKSDLDRISRPGDPTKVGVEAITKAPTTHGPELSKSSTNTHPYNIIDRKEQKITLKFIDPPASRRSLGTTP